MGLTSEEKLDMSLDEIILLQWQKQNAEYRERQRKKRLKYGQYYHNRAYNPPSWKTSSYAAGHNFLNQRRQRPLALFTRKYRQFAAYKSIQRAKYTLLQQYLRKRNEAYKRWEERSCTHEEGYFSTSDDWDDVASNYSAYSTQTNKTAPCLRNTCPWIYQKASLVNVPSNLTIKFRNNLALRSQFNRQRITQSLNHRRALAMKQSPFIVNGTWDFQLKRGLFSRVPASSTQSLPKTLNERFTALQQCVW